LPLAAHADQAAAPPETVIKLTMYPADAPKPALRYLLLPEIKELNPGNPVQNYLKCFMEQQNFFFDKEAFARREKLLTMPLKELPAQELQDYGRAALAQADWAARLDKPDWEILLKMKTDGIGLLIPDIQQVRALATALKVRFRSEVALRRYDDCLRTAKTMFALARHTGEHPTLIGELVGIAIAAVTIGPLEEMLEQPGCPNLYWALTNLPSPLIRMDKGLEGERAAILCEFRGLEDSAPMSEEQVNKLIVHFDKIPGLGSEIQPEKSLRAWMDARLKDEAFVSAARRRLVEAPLSEEQVLRFRADQAILLDQKREYEIRRDDLMKLINLPSWQAAALLAPAKEAPKDGGVFVRILVPALGKVFNAQTRLEQRIALLRHVEALRMYAAQHDGHLPENLCDCPVPLPVDPFTGKPFLYKLDGNTAHVRGSPPPGEEKNPALNVHYEVTIQK
jgi:hypothetical protein